MYRNENAFDDVIAQWSNRYSVPVWVIKATIGKESAFDPTAYNPTDPGSGSRGLMQIAEATARDLGLRGAIGDDTTRTGGLYEPGINVQLGTKYLSQLADRYPGESWDRIYSAYNVGHLEELDNGLLVDQDNVDAWGRVADYFNPGWRSSTGATDAGGNPTTPRGK